MSPPQPPSSSTGQQSEMETLAAPFRPLSATSSATSHDKTVNVCSSRRSVVSEDNTNKSSGVLTLLQGLNNDMIKGMSTTVSSSATLTSTSGGKGATGAGAGAAKVPAPSSSSGYTSSADPHHLETDAFLRDLSFKDRAPIMLFDEPMKYYYRSWKFVSSYRPASEITLIALTWSLIVTYCMRYIGPTKTETNYSEASFWLILSIDATACLLNLFSFSYFKTLSSLMPFNCHNFVDPKHLTPHDDVYCNCKTRMQTLFTFLWTKRHIIVATKVLLEVLSMMILLVQQTFGSHACSNSDVKDLTFRLYWLHCNLNGASQTTSIFTAFRLLMHPFIYSVLAGQEFEYIMTILGIVLAFLAICNLLTPSLAFLHPTINYGIVFGIAMLYNERHKRLLYLKDMRLRYTERKLNIQTNAIQSGELLMHGGMSNQEPHNYNDDSTYDNAYTNAHLDTNVGVNVKFCRVPPSMSSLSEYSSKVSVNTGN